MQAVETFFLYMTESAETQFFARFPFGFCGEAVESAELADGQTVARGYAADGVAALDGVSGSFRLSARTFL